MDIKEILNSIELTDEQEKALDSFFEQHNKDIRDHAVKAYIEEHGEPSEEVAELKEQIILHKKAFEMFEEDCDKAFELFESHCDRAFDKFELDVDKAFELYEEELQQEFTSKMVESLDASYEDLKDKAKQDFLESSEYAAFIKIKDTISPYMEGANKELIARVAELESTLSNEKTKTQELSKRSMIDTFLEGIPEAHIGKARKYLEEAKDEDEVLQRYDLVLAFLEEVAEESILEEDEKPRERPRRLRDRKIYLENLENEEGEKVEPILESVTTEKNEIKLVEDSRLKAFKPSHMSIIKAAKLV